MMKFKLFALLVFVVFFSVSCKKQTSTEEAEAAAKALAQHIADSLAMVGEQKPEIIDSVYLVRGRDDETNWVEYRSGADEYAPKLGDFRLGQKLYVVRYVDDWVGLWTSVRRAEDGSYLDQEVERVVYIKKNQTGHISALHLKQADLGIMYDGDGGEERVPSNVVSFELIKKEEFEKQLKKKDPFLLADTLSIRKKKGVLSLPCQNQTVKLKDETDTDGDSYTEYTYLGQVQALNAYLIRGAYYESGDSFLIDKVSGERIASFNDYPYISPDKKYIVDIWTNPYEDYTEFAIFKIGEDNKIEEAYSYGFSKWVLQYICDDAYNCRHEIYWGNDNAIYVRVQSLNLSGMEGDEYGQYVRVKLKF